MYKETWLLKGFDGQLQKKTQNTESKKKQNNTLYFTYIHFKTSQSRPSPWLTVKERHSSITLTIQFSASGLDRL